MKNLFIIISAILIFNCSRFVSRNEYEAIKKNKIIYVEEYNLGKLAIIDSNTKYPRTSATLFLLGIFLDAHPTNAPFDVHPLIKEKIKPYNEQNYPYLTKIVASKFNNTSLSENILLLKISNSPQNQFHMYISTFPELIYNNNDLSLKHTRLTISSEIKIIDSHNSMIWKRRCNQSSKAMPIESFFNNNNKLLSELYNDFSTNCFTSIINIFNKSFTFKYK